MTLNPFHRKAKAIVDSDLWPEVKVKRLRR